jgi:hypothetical protein
LAAEPKRWMRVTAKNKVREKNKLPADILTEYQKSLCYEMNQPIFEKFGYEK